MFKLSKDTTALLVIDIQERLIKAMPEEVVKKVTDNSVKLVKGFNALGAKVIYSQQYTKGLGNTVPELMECLSGEHIEKTVFSCCGEPALMQMLKDSGIKNVILAGMETHVCVLQTALDLMELGYGVHVAADAVCSRTKMNWKTGLRFMEKAGAVITVTETPLFQMVHRAGTPEFKEISSIIK